MKRLTQKTEQGNILPLKNAVCGIDMPHWRLHEKNDNELFLTGDAVDKLAEYEDAEERGLLIKLPCKVGDNLYFETYINNASENIGIQGHQIIRVDINFICKDKVFPTTIPLWEIGEYVFLTHEEAVVANKFFIGGDEE